MVHDDPCSVEDALDRYGMETVMFLSDHDITTLFSRRDSEYGLDNSLLALCLFAASPLAGKRIGDHLNRFRLPLVEAMLDAWRTGSRPHPSDSETKAALLRFRRAVAYACYSGLIHPPRFPDEGDVVVRPRPWPMEARAAAKGISRKLHHNVAAWIKAQAYKLLAAKSGEDAAADGNPSGTELVAHFDVLSVSPAEIVRFWSPLHHVMRKGDTRPLEAIYDALDEYSQALTRLYLEDIDPVAFASQGQAEYEDLMRRIDGYLERTRCFFEALAAPETTTQALAVRFREVSPSGDAVALPAGADDPPCPRLDPRMAVARHAQALLTLHRCARRRGPLALEAYGDDARLGCPVTGSGLRFFTTLNAPAVLREIVERKSRTMRFEWERKAAMLLTGFRTMAQGDIPFVARVRMEAYAGECCDAGDVLHDGADSELLARMLSRAWPDKQPVADGQVFLLSGMTALTGLSDEAFDALLKQCTVEDLCLCLAFSGDDLREKCRRAFTGRSFAMLQEEVNAMEPQRRSAVEEARERVLAAALAAANPDNAASPS
ncbi:FliG C-terminal domain-containing protein [Solidesulfovibrio sp.]|uniref:FliG C-terminal domain-containing protein n=1 Tax=Solidesulfovibrio sp. TaxID=2910990 RepID=UPI002B1F6E17|nr:FliG C-terminal domain-containing protein [Solidesulfovibrio sp.]MEA5088225.1 FliG C-terminal domain-containing protein [Solidesulfovibrio sp.]